MSNFLADSSVPVIATPDGLHIFQTMERAGGGDILLPPTSCQWFENLPCQMCLCWWQVLQKPGKLGEAPSSQIMDRCALKALRARTIPRTGLDDLNVCSNLSSGMSSKSSICSSPTKVCQALRLSGVSHLYKLHSHLYDDIEDARPCITAAPSHFPEQSEIQLVNSEDFAT